MAFIGEVSRFDVVREVNSPSGDTPEQYTRAAARYNFMLTTSKDLYKQGGTILELRLESVSRFERTASFRVNEDLRPSKPLSRWVMTVRLRRER